MNNIITPNNVTNTNVEEPKQSFKIILLNVTEEVTNSNKSDLTNRVEFEEMSCDDMLKKIVNRCSKTNI
jgi:hypothetical protein